MTGAFPRSYPPAYEPVREDSLLPEFVPIYRLTSGLTSKYPGGLVKRRSSGLDLRRITGGFCRKEPDMDNRLCSPAEAYRFIISRKTMQSLSADEAISCSRNFMFSRSG